MWRTRKCTLPEHLFTFIGLNVLTILHDFCATDVHAREIESSTIATSSRRVGKRTKLHCSGACKFKGSSLKINYLVKSSHRIVPSKRKWEKFNFHLFVLSSLRNASWTWLTPLFQLCHNEDAYSDCLCMHNLKTRKIPWVIRSTDDTMIQKILADAPAIPRTVNIDSIKNCLTWLASLEPLGFRIWSHASTTPCSAISVQILYNER